MRNGNKKMTHCLIHTLPLEFLHRLYSLAVVSIEDTLKVTVANLLFQNFDSNRQT